MISIIIPVLGDDEHLKRCLRALPSPDDGLEILVVDSSRGRAPLPQGIRSLQMPSPASPGAARNAGVKAARGTRVAFLDARCEPSAAWLAAARRPGPAAGGSRRLARPAGAGAWVQYFLEFNEFLPECAPRRARFVPAGNLVMARSEALDRPFDETALAAEDVAWGRGGVEFKPEMQVAYHARTGLKEALAHLNRRGFESAKARVRLGLPGGGLAAWPLLAWLLIPYRFFLIAGRLASADWKHFARYALLSPVMLAGLYSWTSGFRAGVRGTPPRPK